MRKIFCISGLFTLSVMIVAGCYAKPQPATFAYDSEYFKKQEEALISWGYFVKERTTPTPTAWEKATFNIKSKRSIFVKSRKPVPGVATTYYRFTLTQETYADEAQAKNRLENLFQKPPYFDGFDEYEFALRKGYQRDQFVYVLGTDAVLFEKELQRLAKHLQEVLKNS
jgi:hypothetical protein